MIIFTRTFTRPNVDIPFHSEVLDVSAFRERLTLNYINTNKLISQFKEITDDGLVMTYTGIWIDRESFEEYDNDPVLKPYWEARDAYYAENNVIIGPGTIQDL